MMQTMNCINAMYINVDKEQFSHKILYAEIVKHLLFKK